MTSEILIMNKSCVVLAADSAATVFMGEGQKIFSTDKIYSLSKTQPIGMMLYDHSEISGLPVELIVKEFRNSIKDMTFPTLEDCAESFIKYINNGRTTNVSSKSMPIISKSMMEQEIFYHAVNLCRGICENASERSRLCFEDLLKTSHVCSENIREFEEKSLEEEIGLRLKSIDVDIDVNKLGDMVIKTSELIDDEAFNVLNNLDRRFNLDKYRLDIVKILAASIISYDDNDLNYTGIVFAGYGAEDIFPSFIEYKIYGYFLMS